MQAFQDGDTVSNVIDAVFAETEKVFRIAGMKREREREGERERRRGGDTER